MSRDFFLLNRCYQVARLCAADSAGRGVTPAGKSRGKLPIKLAEFYDLLDRVRAVAVGTGETRADDQTVQLSAAQRRDLEDFERLIVANRFSADDAIKQPAVALIRAIFADAAYFSGLKPLPQYTDAFAYELLFPSWLNLLKASMLPRADNGKPRLEGARQGALFEFLGKAAQIDPALELSMIGFMTFIASRFDVPQGEELLQRLVDLISRQGSSLVESLESIDVECKDARALKQRVADFLVVKYSLVAWDADSAYKIAYKRPARRAIPECIKTRLQELELELCWSEYFAIAGPVRQILESPHALSQEFVSLLNRYPQQFIPLLTLLVQRDSQGNAQVLSVEGQLSLAALARFEPDLVSQYFDRLAQFATCVATRMEGFGEATQRTFSRLLIEEASGRKQLLESCGDAALQGSLTEQLLDQAAKSTDDARSLQLMSCACLVSHGPELIRAKPALQAIELVVANRSIGNRELGDLMSDLRANGRQALEYLSSPMLAAAGKNPRMAALYLTLNEVSEKFATTGCVDNFSVVRAKYSKLTNMDFE